MGDGEVRAQKTILMGVTIDDSLQFHSGLPQALVRDGWDVHVVTGPGRRIELLRGEAGIHVHVLPMTRDPSPWNDIVSFLKWFNLIRAVRPDVTFIGTPKASLLGNVAARLLRVPRRIYVLLGMRLETSTGSSRRVLHLLEQLTAWSAHEVLAVSESLKRLAIDMRITTEMQAVVLGAGSCNGVDVARYRCISEDTRRLSEVAKEIGLDRSIATIGFVGRLTRDKGLPELSGALRKLREEGLELQVLVVGGVDDESGRAGLAELHLTGQRIVAVGYREDTAVFYPLMDVLCLPSLREGLPNVLLEAMASGTVVIGSDATGIVDLVENQVTGYLISRGSVDQLADAIRYALLNRSRSSELATAALEFVNSNFDTEIVQSLIRGHLARPSSHPAQLSDQL